MPRLQLWPKVDAQGKELDYRESLMIQSLKTLPVSDHLEGLPTAEIVSGYFITLAGLLLNSHELLASITFCGRVAQHNDALCGFIWNLTFHLNLLSARTVWCCFCTGRHSKQPIPVLPSTALVIFTTPMSLKTSVSPGWGFLPSQSFRIRSSSIL